MARTDVPKPLLALVGAVAEVRRLPAHAMNVGITVLALADRARRDYARFAERGERVVAGAFGNAESPEEVLEVPEPVVEDETVVVLDVVSHVADPLDKVRTMPEPLPGYDGMTLGALRGRLRSLTDGQLHAVLRYEKAHRNRHPMVTLVEHRLAKIALNDDSA